MKSLSNSLVAAKDAAPDYVKAVLWYSAVQNKSAVVQEKLTHKELQVFVTLFAGRSMTV